MQRLVVGAVDADQLVHPFRVEGLHLGLQARPPDRPHELLVLVLAAEHLAGGVAHRGEDDSAGIDHGSVQIEEDDAALGHAFDRSSTH